MPTKPKRIAHGNIHFMVNRMLTHNIQICWYSRV